MTELARKLPDDADATGSQQPSRLALSFALAGAPAAWIAQLVSGYVLANRPCINPAQTFASRVPAAGFNHPAPLIVQVICLGMALAAVLLAANIWRTSGRRDASAVIEKGAGRTHFLAMCGLAGGIGFAVSILFDTPGLFVVPLCPN